MRRRPAWPRKLADTSVKLVSVLSALIGLTALAWILLVVLRNGAAALDWTFLTSLPSPPGGVGDTVLVGAEDEGRTRDLLLGKEALCH